MLQNSTLRGSAEMAAAMLISGTIGWFVVMSGLPVADVVFWRCVFGAATLLAICAALGVLRPGTVSARVLLIASIGGVAIVANWLLLFAAYSRASISIATVVYNTQPFMLLAFGVLLFGERVTLRKLGWLGLAFVGMLLVVLVRPNASYAGAQYLVGILLALGAAFLYAVAAVAAKKLTGTPPHLIALIQVTVGIAMLLPLANLSSPPSGGWQWSMVAVVGVVHTGLMYVLLYGAIQKLPTSLTASLSYIYPVAAVLVDFIAFGHRLQALQILGSLAILLAAAGMNLGWSFRVPARSALPFSRPGRFRGMV